MSKTKTPVSKVHSWEIKTRKELKEVITVKMSTIIFEREA